MQSRGKKIVNIQELAPVTFNVPPPPPAYVQTVDPQKVGQGSSSFKDYYHSKIKDFESKLESDNTFVKKAADYIKRNEGVKNKLYKDNKGLWTIGIGHLVSPEEINLYKGKTLTDEEVYSLFDRDMQKKLSMVRRDFPKYDSYSEDLKIAILDGYFRGDLSGSPKTRELIKSGNYKAAANEYLNHKEYKAAVASGSGVAKRMQRNARIIANQI